LSNSILGIKTITSFNLRNRIVALYSSYLAPEMNKAVKKGFTVGFGFGFGQLVPQFANAVAFYYGGWLIEEGIITFQDLIQAFFWGALFGNCSWSSCSCRC